MSLCIALTADRTTVCACVSAQGAEVEQVVPVPVGEA
jgi:hypothetical protein